MMETPKSARTQKLKFRARTGVLILVYLAGFVLRLVDLTDPPLDFHAWRQLRSASIARGIAYSLNDRINPQLKEQARALAKFELLEPPLFEAVAGTLYAVLGVEALWLARLVGIIAWMIGAAALFVLARRWTSPWGAAVAVTFFLFLPFGVQVSRAVLPDLLMAVWLIVAALFLDRWTEFGGTGSAVLAGVACGMAIFTKVFAFFPLFLLAGSLVVVRSGLSKALRDRHTFIVLLLAGGIPVTYYFVLQSGSATSYLSSWVFPFSKLIVQPWFYLRWSIALYRSVGIVAIILALLGIGLSRPPLRIHLVALWAGYVLFGFSIPSLIISHSYYHALFIPILALSIAPLGARVADFLRHRQSALQVITPVGLTLGLVFWGYLSVQDMLARDYRDEVLGWEKMGRELPDDARLLGLTHDYNARIRYYGWTQIAQWPHATDFEMNVLAGGNYDGSDPSIAEPILERLSDYDYFVITLFQELERQPVLAQVLKQEFREIDREGYLLYDLRGE
jgi:4-amino-4-deoxy-L-arabinose transferase-like glycosyltransferase